MSEAVTGHMLLRYYAALAQQAPAADRTRVGLRIAGAMSYYWYRRGHYADGRRWLGRAVTLSAEAGEGPELLDAMHSLGVLVGRQFGQKF